MTKTQVHGRRLTSAVAVAIAAVLGVGVYRVTTDTGAGCGMFTTSVNSATDASSSASVGDIVLLDSRLQPCRQLTHDGQSKGPAISPDGRRIAFISGRGYSADSDNGMNDFQSPYIMSINGSGQRRLATTLATGPISWSPDSRRMAYVVNQTRTQVSAALLDVDNGRQTQITWPATCTLDDWLDEGHLALECSRPDNSMAIESLDLQSGNRREILTLPTVTSRWTPRYLVVLPSASRASSLEVRDLRTGQTHDISGSEVTGAGSYSSVLLITSDNRIIWERHEHLGTYDVYESDLAGGPAHLLRRQHGEAFLYPLSDNPAR